MGEECWTEQRQQCTTEYERQCETSYQQQCETQHQEECWNEIEEECVHEQDCSEPEHHSYPSSTGGSRHKRSIPEEEDEQKDDEEVDAMLRSALEEMSASDFLELTSDLSDDELNQLTEEAEDEADNTDVAIVDGKSRSKRGIILGTAIKKALLGGALAGAILPGAKKKKAVKAKVLIGSQKKSGSSKKS